jgi:glycosyltransferase involved in cell wall biosynthesis
MARGLRDALRKVADVVDVALLGNQADVGCDAVLLIDCVARVREPFFIYLGSQDSLVASHHDAYADAAGIFAENDCWARSVAQHPGISREKVHVILPALLQRENRRRLPPLRMRPAPRLKLLYINRQREQESGCQADRLVLDALQILRRDYDPRVSLTMAGVQQQQLGGSPPAGVSVRGPLAPGASSVLLDDHDLLVMPSPLEPFGLVFAEAMARGLPSVVAATSEVAGFITPGVSGGLVDTGDAAQLASVIAATLADDGIYQACYERAPAMAAYFSWERVARQIAAVISREVRRISLAPRPRPGGRQ